MDTELYFSKSVTEPSVTRLLNVREVAKILNVSRSFAYRMMINGDLRVVRFGRSVRINQLELEKFIESHSSQ